MLRGNGGHDIFFSDQDRHHLYRLVQDGVSRFRYRVHGFCLMTNHLHLALQVGAIPLSRCMQNLAFRYTRWINRREKRVGHLFQGRYQTVLVDRDSYLLELVRYIHLNPVRTGMVKKAVDYRWSGHRTYLWKAEIPWLTTDWILGQFGRRLGEARQRYGMFVREGVGEGYREEFHRGSEDSRVVGDDDFVGKVLDRLDERIDTRPSLYKIVRTVRQAYGMKEAELRVSSQRRVASEARAVIGWLAMELGSATLSEVGRWCKRDVATISSAVRRLVERATERKALQKHMEGLKSQVK